MTPLDRAAAALIVHKDDPLNAEPAPCELIAEYLTPQRLFYVRSHGQVPTLGEDHAFVLDGLVAEPARWTRAELAARFPVRTVTAVLQCAGNRRAHLREVAETSGDPWDVGAIGNGAWTGVSLIDLLRAVGLDEARCRFVRFTGADEVEVEGETAPFGISLPMGKACDPDVLIAWALNGEPLAPEHGAPLRLVTPGYAGVRSAKWLTRIEATDEPSQAPVQQRDYKLFPPDESGAKPDWSAGLTIEEMPVNAAICSPADGGRVAPGTVRVAGYATAYARGVAWVELSADGGLTWRQAVIERCPDARWGWVRWSADIELPPGTHRLAVRAVDGAGQRQPADPAQVWNYAGYLSSAWHRIAVRAE
ncbi:molybdopterin-dependent oxidoreductase [Sphingomonas sp.]|uniref:molybdopterin-dependent oxidoreductase n=1 Tax=Sphingomonas sp. TaxID=28214 RepID=UPI003B002018